MPKQVPFVTYGAASHEEWTHTHSPTSAMRGHGDWGREGPKSKRVEMHRSGRLTREIVACQGERKRCGLNCRIVQGFRTVELGRSLEFSLVIMVPVRWHKLGARIGGWPSREIANGALGQFLRTLDVVARTRESCDMV